MAAIVLIIHLLLALGIVGFVLLQRSEGGGLGIGGSTGGGGGGMGGLVGGPFGVVARSVAQPMIDDQNVEIAPSRLRPIGRSFEQSAAVAAAGEADRDGRVARRNERIKPPCERRQEQPARRNSSAARAFTASVAPGYSVGKVVRSRHPSSG